MSRPNSQPPEIKLEPDEGLQLENNEPADKTRQKDNGPSTGPPQEDGELADGPQQDGNDHTDGCRRGDSEPAVEVPQVQIDNQPAAEPAQEGVPNIECLYCQYDLIGRSLPSDHTPRFKTEEAYKTHYLTSHKKYALLTFFGITFIVKREPFKGEVPEERNRPVVFYCPFTDASNRIRGLTPPGQPKMTQKFEGITIKKDVQVPSSEYVEFILCRQAFRDAAGLQRHVEEEHIQKENAPKLLIAPQLKVFFGPSCPAGTHDSKATDTIAQTAPELAEEPTRSRKRKRMDEQLLEKDDELSQARTRVERLDRTALENIVTEMETMISGEWDVEKAEEAEARIEQLTAYRERSLRVIKEVLSSTGAESVQEWEQQWEQQWKVERNQAMEGLMDLTLKEIDLAQETLISGDWYDARHPTDVEARIKGIREFFKSANDGNHQPATEASDIPPQPATRFPCEYCRHNLLVKSKPVQDCPDFASKDALSFHIKEFHDDLALLTIFGNTFLISREIHSFGKDGFRCPFDNCDQVEYFAHSIQGHVRRKHQNPPNEPAILSSTAGRPAYYTTFLYSSNQGQSISSEIHASSDATTQTDPATAGLKTQQAKDGGILHQEDTPVRKGNTIESLKEATKQKITSEIIEMFRGDWDVEKAKEVEKRVEEIKAFHESCLKTLMDLEEKDTASDQQVFVRF
ncbi:hypothetical protein BJ508DRAFT_367686 [Ascobolus immersus RN42]|uniref:Uncharacterized protein n=1 Tax=Ascobolus immersus RN42 TaxID=1160509 RepID=A0A3N4HAR0_ASCIM|nr:hypothetical protein BJ508DRAFT_367686 [Ascobolus immersus RN42]